ncbi:hypothetical protein [Chitinolyticbacter albus]|uniref:hypothetical protein n=1 Tax=Chitinolyticbacter albus TaxID=2961951 RepID=UPI00210AF04E|nr:hypothetical protein [Chitinolyticbacter albus]
MIPALVIHTNLLLSNWMGGRAFGPLVLIRPSQRDRTALLEHELEHVRQWWWLATPAIVLAGLLAALPVLAPWRGWLVALAGFGLVLQAPLYLLLRPYRMWSEVMAYRVTLRHASPAASQRQLAQAAASLAQHYWLRISESTACELLSGAPRSWWQYWRVPRS